MPGRQPTSRSIRWRETRLATRQLQPQEVGNSQEEPRQPGVDSDTAPVTRETVAGGMTGEESSLQGDDLLRETADDSINPAVDDVDISHLFTAEDSRDQPELLIDFVTMEDSASVPRDNADQVGLEEEQSADSSSALTQQPTVSLNIFSPENDSAIDNFTTVKQPAVDDAIDLAHAGSVVPDQRDLRAEQNPPSADISCQQTSSLVGDPHVEDIDAARCHSADHELHADYDDDVAVVDRRSVDTSVDSRPLCVELDEESISDDLTTRLNSDPTSMEFDVTSLNTVDQQAVGSDQSSNQSTTAAVVGSDVVPAPESTKRWDLNLERPMYGTCPTKAP